MGKTTMIDMSNQIYKNWKILQRAEPPEHIKNKSASVWWLCECIQCKSHKVLNGSEIRANKSGACKCKEVKNKVKSKNKLTTINNVHKVKNEIGNIYGKLLVKSFAYVKNSHAYWNCECECGKQVVVKGNALRTQAIQSCGCQRSRKETEIAIILDNNNIIYQREFTFEDLKDKGRLRFDFAIFNQNNKLIGLIEYQGQQHYEPNNKFSRNGLLQEHDNMKLIYCKQHNIPLLILNKDNIDLSNDILLWISSLL